MWLSNENGPSLLQSTQINNRVNHLPPSYANSLIETRDEADAPPAAKERALIFEAQERRPRLRRKRKTAGQKTQQFNEKEDNVLLEEAKRRNDITVLATSSLLNLQVIIAVQQESKVRQ